MKALLLSLTLLLTSAISPGQISLTLSSKNKKYTIRSGEECYIRMLATSNDTANNYYQIHIGQVIGVNDSILTLSALGRNTVYTTKDGTKKLDRAGLDYVPVDLKIKEIEEIENFRNWFMVPASIGWLSLVSTVVVSPLVSANFKTRTFNTNRFIKVGGISFGTAALSMTIAYGFGRHSSYINHGQKKHKRLWTVQKQ